MCMCKYVYIYILDKYNTYNVYVLKLLNYLEINALSTTGKIPNSFDPP